MISARLSRRSLIGAAAAAGLGSSRLAAAARETGLPPLGIQIYSLRGYPVEEALRHAKDLGFEQVEFFGGMYPVSSDAAAIAAMNARLAGLGLTISAHGVNGFGADATANKKVFAFAKEAGIRTITADPSPDSFDSLESLVKEFDIRIAIHNHGPRHRYNKAIDVLRAIEGRDERIGACADLGHFIRSGEDPVEVIRLLAGRLYGVHLKDFAEMQDKSRGVILGRGHLDVPAVFAALERARFPEDGALSLEYEENPQNPLDDIRACVEAANEALAES